MLTRLTFAIWLLLWARIGFPWRSFQPSPSFDRLALVPFADGSPRGYILNVLVFVPIGVIGTRLRWDARITVGIGLLISVATECLQLFSTRRYPSVTDVILNTLGVTIGVAMSMLLVRARTAR
jgi:glycopeptide antibiotics resistance protein